MTRPGICTLSFAILLAGTSYTVATETSSDQLPVSKKNDNVLSLAESAPIQVIVSRKDQRLRVFRGNEEIATSRVSTGKRGHTTPTGIYSILEKRTRHYSNIYNNAPMPYMQRLTWSGIALHESGSVPNYPASHGCVRLPRGFAKKLFGLTERGAHVVISNRDTAPRPITHEALFQPRELEDLAQLSALASSQGTETQIQGKISLLSERPARDQIAHELAMRLNRLTEIRDSDKPLRIFITRQARGNLVNEVQKLLNQLGFDAGAEDGLAGSATVAAIKAFKASRQGSIDERIHGKGKTQPDTILLSQLYAAAGKGKVPTGHLFVRHSFKPLFDAPIHIKDVDTPLGAHLISASLSRSQEGELDWLSVNLGDRLSASQKDRLGIKSVESDNGLVSAEDVLERIIIPDGVRAQINHLINKGSSITISDRGFGRETTPQGTDFIVQTRPIAPTAVASKGNAKRKKVVKRKKATSPKKTSQSSRKLTQVRRQSPDQFN